MKILITDDNQLSEMEIFTMMYRCPMCEYDYLMKDFKYCPSCGNELVFVFQGAENARRDT